jgi:hypothetical protein
MASRAWTAVSNCCFRGGGVGFIKRQQVDHAILIGQRSLKLFLANRLAVLWVGLGQQDRCSEQDREDRQSASDGSHDFSFCLTIPTGRVQVYDLPRSAKWVPFRHTGALCVVE